MLNIQSPLSGIRSPFGRRGGFSPAILFAGGEPGVWYDPSDLTTLFQDTAGTIPVTTAGQTAGLMLDKSGNDLHATQATAAARPSYIVDADGIFIQHDLIDDALTVTLPDMGTEATVAYVTRSEVRLLEDQTISGSYTLPTQEIAGFVAIDRALTIAEKVNLIRYLASKVEGVNYGAEIDRLTLIALNAVDVFVYDTSKDSDGGAWATGYPAQMIVIGESTSVKIYDATEPDAPLHTTLDFTGYTVRAVTALSGVLSVATSTGLATFNLADGDVTVALDYTTATSPAIVNNSLNDCAMTVLPDAPIDPATGLPVPTIAVATAGGVSVIKDDGTVVDITCADASFTMSTIVDFKGSQLWMNQGNGGSVDGIFIFNTVPTADTALTLNSKSGTGANADAYYKEHPSLGDLHLVGDSSLDFNNAVSQGAIGSNDGLNHIAENPDAPKEGMVAYTTSTYNTGWMNGDIKGAFLSDTDDTDLVGGTDADRSVNDNSLTVNGTVTRSPVATGADLVAYSGFSPSNYLEQPYNSDLDFGTGDFCVMGWVKATTISANNYLVSRNSNPNAQRWDLRLNASGFPEFTVDDDTTARTASYSTNASNTGWHHYVGIYDGAGGVFLYVDGVLRASATGAALLTVSNTSAKLVVGAYAVDYITPATSSSIALLRISATAPTADQIAKIYADELPLFQNNAAATLYGASDAVTALAHDPDTGLLHVGTSAGRSVFQGLQRVGNTTTSVSTSISASGGLIVEK